MARKTLNVYTLTGTGYENGWFTNCHCRYRAFKGARNTKKSYDIIGIEVLCKIISNPLRNVIILRNVNATNRTSTFATICMLIHHPDPENPEVSLDRYFKINNADMTITYKPTGQVIMFFGMGDPSKITSTRMVYGYLTDIYVEEAFEIKSFKDWRKVDGSLRGKLPDGLFLQVTFCFNAWNKNHWLYEHFFKGRLEDDLNYLLTHDFQEWCDPNLVIDYGRGLYLHISTYKINEFRDKEIYDTAMEQLRQVAPELYKVEALGMWGNSTAQTYPEMNESLIKPQNEVNTMRYACFAVGIDFGISDGEGRVIHGKDAGERLGSATTMQLVGITSDYNKLVAIDEWFYSNERELIKKTGPAIQQELVSTLKKWRDETYFRHPDLLKGTICVYVDCADSGGFRQGLELEAQRQGLYGVAFLKSTKLMISSRIYMSRLLMAYGDYLFSRNCVNLIREINNARQADDGRMREDFDDHAINAHEYAWASIIKQLRAYKTFKLKE